MTIRIAPLPEGSRVQVMRSDWPQDPVVTGKAGTVVSASEYRHNQVGVLINGEAAVRYFMPTELKVTAEPLAVGERELAKERKPLP